MHSEGVTDYDVVIVGSGFGGSASALRPAEKGEPNPTWIPLVMRRYAGSPRRSTASRAAPSATSSTFR